MILKVLCLNVFFLEVLLQQMALRTHTHTHIRRRNRATEELHINGSNSKNSCDSTCRHKQINFNADLMSLTFYDYLTRVLYFWQYFL